MGEAMWWVNRGWDAGSLNAEVRARLFLKQEIGWGCAALYEVPLPDCGGWTRRRTEPGRSCRSSRARKKCKWWPHQGLEPDRKFWVREGEEHGGQLPGWFLTPPGAL